MPAKDTKMVSSKKSGVVKKAKIGALTRAGSTKAKKSATRSLSLSKVKQKSSPKSKTAPKAVGKTVAKVARKAEPPARRAAKTGLKKVVSRSAPARKAATPVRATSNSKPKVAAPVAIASTDRPVVIEQPVVDHAKRKELEKKPLGGLRSSTVGALKAFDAAMKAFNRHNFINAKEAFEQLLTRYGGEVEIAARVRTYLAICMQRLAPPKALPRNIDVLYNQGVVELNRGNIGKAIELFERALKIQPQADYVLYSLAAAQARSGALPEALANLRRSIELDKLLRNRVKARRDPDFSPLFENREFQELVGIEVEPESAEPQVK